MPKSRKNSVSVKKSLSRTLAALTLMGDISHLVVPVAAMEVVVVIIMLLDLVPAVTVVAVAVIGEVVSVRMSMVHMELMTFTLTWWGATANM